MDVFEIFTNQILKAVVQYPEFEWPEEPEENVSTTFSYDLKQFLCTSSDIIATGPVMYMILYTVYRDTSARFRLQLRRVMGEIVKEFSSLAHRNVCVGVVLDVMERVLAGEDQLVEQYWNGQNPDGDNSPNSNSMELEPTSALSTQNSKQKAIEIFKRTDYNGEKLLTHKLLQLHTNNKWYQWDRQLSLFGTYHKPLHRVIDRLIKRRTSDIAVENQLRGGGKDLQNNDSTQV